MEGQFVNGKLYERTVHTSKGPVGLLAETIIEGDRLTLKDVTVFGRGKELKAGLTREIFAEWRKLVDEAKAQGFNHLRITGQRSLQSTSAKPGKIVDFTADLRRESLERKQPQPEQEKEKVLSHQRHKLRARSRGPRGYTRGRGGHEHER
jgi:hypothetical protein